MTAAAKSIVRKLKWKLGFSGQELSVSTDKISFNGAYQSMVVNDHTDAATLLQRVEPKTRTIGQWDVGRAGSQGQPPNFNLIDDKGQKGVASGKIKISASPMGYTHMNVSVAGASAKTDVSKWVWLTDDKDFSLTPPAGFPGIPDGYIQYWNTGTYCRVYELSVGEKNILAAGGGIDGEIDLGILSLITSTPEALSADRTCYHHLEILNITIEILEAVSGGPVNFSIKNGGAAGTDVATGSGVLVTAAAAKGAKFTLLATDTLVAAQKELHQGELYNFVSKVVGTAITAGTARVTVQTRNRLAL